MLAFNDPTVEYYKDSADSFKQWFDVDDDSLPDLEPFIHSDQDLFCTNICLVRDTDRHQWNDLVYTYVVSWFYGDMSVCLNA